MCRGQYERFALGNVIFSHPLTHRAVVGNLVLIEKNAMAALNCKTVIIDEELTPSQQVQLSSRLDMRPMLSFPHSHATIAGLPQSSLTSSIFPCCR
jgi:hypothetical protein